jgi:hypothetical protein
VTDSSLSESTREWLAQQPADVREEWLRDHAARMAKRAQRRATRDAAAHYLYTLSGPQGVYVGCTSAPEQRCLQHFSHAYGRPNWGELLVNEAMRAGDPTLWKLRFVATVRGFHAARAAENDLIEAFRMAGSPVFNGRRRKQPGESLDEARERRRARILAAREGRRGRSFRGYRNPLPAVDFQHPAQAGA